MNKKELQKIDCDCQSRQKVESKMKTHKYLHNIYFLFQNNKESLSY